MKLPAGNLYLYLRSGVQFLRNGNYLDKKLANKLLARYHVVVVPMLNPWGYARRQRTNSNGIDLNRDFFNQTQSEVKAVVADIIGGGVANI